MSDAINSAGADRLWARLQSTESCLDYVCERTADRVRDRGQLASRLFYRAGQILGCDNERARNMVRMIVRRGGYAQVQKWLAEPPAMPPWVIPGPSLDLIGFVYLARVTTYPHVLKVGFSSNPERRMKELEFKFGEPMQLLSYEVGTPLDEASAHCGAGKRYIGREFVFAPDFDDVRPGRIPPFLLGPFSHLAED